MSKDRPGLLDPVKVLLGLFARLCGNPEHGSWIDALFFQHT